MSTSFYRNYSLSKFGIVCLGSSILQQDWRNWRFTMIFKFGIVCLGSSILQQDWWNWRSTMIQGVYIIKNNLEKNEKLEIKRELFPLFLILFFPKFPERISLKQMPELSNMRVQAISYIFMLKSTLHQFIQY